MKIYYSIQNGGDGSAYPLFFTREDLTEWDQEHMDDGWGEPCTGEIEIHGGNIQVPEAMDEVSYWLLRIEDEHYEPWKLRDEYLEKFFPRGLPYFFVEINGDYHEVYVEGVLKHKYFKNGTKEQLETRLNAQLSL